MKKIFGSVLAMFALMMVLGITSMAQDKMMKDDKMKDDKMMKDGKMMKDDHMMMDAKPVVAIIRADWCPACQKIDPDMMSLMKEYGDRLTFVILDVTDDAKIKESEAIAQKHGLTAFFKTNKKKTSTIAIFNTKHKQIFKTDHNYDRNVYVKAFDSAIEKHKMMKG